MQLAQLLTEHNRRRFTPSLPINNWKEKLRQDCELSELEVRWVESLRAEVTEQAQKAPRDAVGFLKWFEALKQNGPGQYDPLFPWLEKHATHEQLQWFIYQEVAGEAGFEDLVALTQVRVDTRPKLELARNYWDEMGRGSERGMHGPMLARTADELEIDRLKFPQVDAALNLANLLSALAFHRPYTYHSIGALGVVELTAPTRTELVAKGLKRVGTSPAGAQYYTLHASLDVKHSMTWNAEVLVPLVETRPEVAQSLAEGALMRLHAGARCFEAYREHFSRDGVVF